MSWVGVELTCPCLMAGGSAACRPWGLFLGVCVVHALSVPSQREVIVLEDLEEGGASPAAVDATRRVRLELGLSNAARSWV